MRELYFDDGTLEFIMENESFIDDQTKVSTPRVDDLPFMVPPEDEAFYLM